jgi:hypothetical protein
MVGGGGCGLGDDRAVINNRLHQTLCNFAFDLKKKKIFGLGRRRSRSFNFSPTAEQPVRDFTTQVGRTLRFPVHSFRVKSIQKEKYQRKFGRKSLLIVCAFNVNPFLFFPIHPRLYI